MGRYEAAHIARSEKILNDQVTALTVDISAATVDHHFNLPFFAGILAILRSR